jgi:pilus assembly protein CpaC
VTKVQKFILAWVLTLITLTVNATDQISMFIGEIRILEVGAIDRVAVGKGDLLSTSILENGQLLILAEKKGETTIHIWYSDGAESDLKVQILEADTNRIVTELETLLSDLADVRVKVVGQKIFLTGTLKCIAGQETCAEDEIVKTVLTAYGDVMNLTRPTFIQPPTILPANKMVSMEVKITEFNTNVLNDLGIKWDDVITGPSAALAHIWVGSDLLIPLMFTGANSPNPVSGTTSADPDTGATPTFASASGTVGIGTDIASVINLLVQTGDVVILAEPRLSARSGGHAEFLAGGEIPIVTTSLAGTNVEYKEFGILLNISPVVDDENNIMATVATEISDINESLPLNPPGFISRKTTTEVNMKDGETLILSGLLSRRLSENADKFPILGDIPVLGALFRSTRWRNDLTEMVIFVTPTVFDAKSEFNQKNVNRRRELIDEFSEKTEIDKERIIDRGNLIID